MRQDIWQKEWWQMRVQRESWPEQQRSLASTQSATFKEYRWHVRLNNWRNRERWQVIAFRKRK